MFVHGYIIISSPALGLRIRDVIKCFLCCVSYMSMNAVIVCFHMHSRKFINDVVHILKGCFLEEEKKSSHLIRDLVLIIEGSNFKQVSTKCLLQFYTLILTK